MDDITRKFEIYDVPELLKSAEDNLLKSIDNDYLINAFKRIKQHSANEGQSICYIEVSYLYSKIIQKEPPFLMQCMDKKNNIIFAYIIDPFNYLEFWNNFVFEIKLKARKYLGRISEIRIYELTMDCIKLINSIIKSILEKSLKVINKNITNELSLLEYISFGLYNSAQDIIWRKNNIE